MRILIVLLGITTIAVSVGVVILAVTMDDMPVPLLFAPLLLGAVLMIVIGFGRGRSRGGDRAGVEPE